MNFHQRVLFIFIASRRREPSSFRGCYFDFFIDEIKVQLASDMGDETSETGTTGTRYHYCLFERVKTTTPCPEGELLLSSTDCRKDGVTGYSCVVVASIAPRDYIDVH